jgi:hypothetical protein
MVTVWPTVQRAAIDNNLEPVTLIRQNQVAHQAQGGPSRGCYRGSELTLG